MYTTTVLPHEICSLYEDTGLEMYNRGDYEFAEQLFQAALEYARKFKESAESQAVKHNNLGVVLYAQGIYQQAESHFRQGMEYFTKNLGIRHAFFPTILRNYSLLLCKTGRSLEAEGLEVCADVMEDKTHSFTTLTCLSMSRNKTGILRLTENIPHDWDELLDLPQEEVA